MLWFGQAGQVANDLFDLATGTVFVEAPALDASVSKVESTAMMLRGII